MPAPIPVALFAYARPTHLRVTLDSLERNHVPRIYAFSDGPRTPALAAAVAEVRTMLRAVRWCEIVLCERATNLGLGTSVVDGVTRVLDRHPEVIVFEDDFFCVPGTYEYLCAALDHYRDDPRVLSVSAWTHPRVTPAGLAGQPFFSMRSNIWVWGTWARAWHGMERSARSWMRECRGRGIDVYRYGADLPVHGEIETDRNTWGARFIYLHFLRNGLCLCPPHSMAENIGFDAAATNTSHDDGWSNGTLAPAPSIPAHWPEPVEHPEIAGLWRAACGSRPAFWRRWTGRTRRSLGRAARRAGWIAGRDR
jgi:hypothetical protein